ncbi:MAG: ATPase, T2SS/T4P/T4SS family [Actinomycetota bacterium]
MTNTLGAQAASEAPVFNRAAARRRRIGEVLVSTGTITEDQLHEALAAQAAQPADQQRKKLGTMIVDLGLASELQIAHALGEAIGVQVVDLAQTAISPETARVIPRNVAERYGLLALEWNGRTLKVAIADPTNVVALDDARLYTKAHDLHVVVATESGIREHLTRIWSLAEDSSDMVTMLEDVDAESDADFITSSKDADSTPVVRLVNVILADAVRARASDIHVEPQLKDVRIRYRIDGLLRDVMTVPKNAAAPLTSRIKIISGLDIAERRRPQDGRARLAVDGVHLDARISSLPTMHGEKIVIRLLARADNVPPLIKSGMEEKQLEDVLTAMLVPQGLILITGPTGSGKTSTLYSAINQIRTPDRNIVTLEDPVEIQLPGVNQVQVHEKSGLTFARGLRSILRQDPDIVLVGEVRDLETAELALQASLTGHMVLTTLHTNGAIAAIARFIDMGVEPFLVASSLSLVVAQRLVRTPCLTCIGPYTPSPRTMKMLGLVESDLEDAVLRRGRGCNDCGQTGYKGRVGIYEVLPVTAGVRAALIQNPTEANILVAAQAAGMISLRAAGLLKALRGETTLEEILRVTHVDIVDGTRCPACDRGVEEDMLCCPWCGTDVDRGNCGSCAKPLDADWRICPYCRTETSKKPDGLRPSTPHGAGRESRRILVVDDDPTVCGFVEAALDGQCEVLSAGTAEVALRIAGTEDLGAIILDLVLPDLSGIELARLLRADNRTALVPLIMLTGTDDRRTETEALLAGADDYLTKPIDPTNLSERVLAILDLHSRTGAHG